MDELLEEEGCILSSDPSVPAGKPGAAPHTWVHLCSLFPEVAKAVPALAPHRLPGWALQGQVGYRRWMLLDSAAQACTHIRAHTYMCPAPPTGAHKVSCCYRFRNPDPSSFFVVINRMLAPSCPLCVLKPYSPVQWYKEVGLWEAIRIRCGRKGRGVPLVE